MPTPGTERSGPEAPGLLDELRPGHRESILHKLFRFGLLRARNLGGKIYFVFGLCYCDISIRAAGAALSTLCYRRRVRSLMQQCFGTFFDLLPKVVEPQPR